MHGCRKIESRHADRGREINDPFRADTAAKQIDQLALLRNNRKTVFRVVIRIKTCGRIVVWTTARRATRRLRKPVDDSMNARIFNRALKAPVWHEKTSFLVQFGLASRGISGRRGNSRYLLRISSIARRRIAKTLFLSSGGASNFSQSAALRSFRTSRNSRLASRHSDLIPCRESVPKFSLSSSSCSANSLWNSASFRPKRAS